MTPDTAARQIAATMATPQRIAVVPGDGIGIDVTREAVKVLEAVREIRSLPIDLVSYDYGAEKYLREHVSLPAGQIDEWTRDFSAIFLGALGDPRVPDMRHAADILFGMRFGMDLYINFRPVVCLDERLCPLRDRTEKDVNLVVFRENTEGLYAGMGGIFKKGTPDEVATQEEINTRKGVERIMVAAFEHARAKGRKKVLMSDKSNALRYGGDLWQRTFEDVRRRYPGIEAGHMYIDALAMQLIKNPAQFEVVVTSNLFGDIITDVGAQLQGGLGMAASANLHPGRTSMFEPVHGSAPKYAGKNVANPIGAILTSALMLETVGYAAEARIVEAAVADAVKQREVTADVGGRLGTRETGDAVTVRVRKRAEKA